MCTAVSYSSNDFFFGRTLDYECSYGESVAITPRNFKLDFKMMPSLNNHFAIIGMAHIKDNYPLYYDAFNEKGLAAAGLNFVGNAYYKKTAFCENMLAPFELIPFILAKCDSVKSAVEFLSKTELLDIPFCDELPNAQLHWIFADNKEAITFEATKDGNHIYNNQIGVLTNNPTFDMQMNNLSYYMQLSNKPPINNFSGTVDLNIDSRGGGGFGLPGDLTSMSRFVRAAFVKTNSKVFDNNNEALHQFFHILGSVQQQKGCCILENGMQEHTIYSSCCNTALGDYCYTTYNRNRITAVNLFREKLDSENLIIYPMLEKEAILPVN